MHKRALSAALLLVASACLGTASAQRLAPISTTEGKVTGVASHDGSVVSFKGIPYAAPPIGALRWRAPQPHAPWKGILAADHFGASCMQGPNNEFGPWTREFLYVTPPSEDCLFLNIWTPQPSRAAHLPVLVFIHGGAFTGGSGDVPVYDGEHLARTGMVVVTINYRLGPFGFLALPALSAESAHHSSGNYGLLDQIAALKWVQANIRAFGGDPARVAVAGQSAGAMSVEDLLASPLAKGLFSAAIADSGIGGRGIPVQTLAETEKEGAAFAARQKADSLDALRALPASQLLAAPGIGLHFAPIVDGWVLPGQPRALTTQPGGNDVPVLTGFQQDDYRLGGVLAITAAQFQQRARHTYGSMADEFLRLYPAATDQEAMQSEAASGHDRLRAGMYLWASRRVQTHHARVYVYYFDRAIPWPAHPEFGVFHTGEIPYAFGTLDKLDRPWEPVDFRLSKTMMAYWKNMAASGNPNGPSLPAWASVSPSQSLVMQLGAQSGPIPPADAARLDFWKRYFASQASSNAPVF